MFKVGYLPLSKESWKTDLILGIVERTIEQLKQIDAEVIFADSLVTNEREAGEVCDGFVKSGVDALIVHFATFPIGAAIPEIARRANVPILLLANPESEHTGGVLQQNSFCGANMAAHTLHQMGHKYAFVWAEVEDTAKELSEQIKVLDCIATLENTRFGLAGGRVPGFYTSNFSELKLREKLGVGVEVMDLVEIIDAANKVTDAEAKKGGEEVRAGSSKCNGITEETIGQAGKLLTAFRKLAEKYNLNGYAVRCWPEFPDIFGIAPCAVLGMLNNSGLLASCEGDIHGAVTMLIQKQLSGGALPFFVDLIKFDYKENTGVVWHCGAAPAGLCRDFSETSLRLHMRVDGGDKKGLTNDFPLKGGRITLAKLDESPEGKYRMLVATGEALDTDPFLRGNPLNIRFDASMRELINTIMKQGFEHHYCVVHADVKNELLALCEWLDIEVVSVG